MKTYSKLLAIKEMQIKTTRRYHYTPTRMAKIKKLITPNGGKDVDQRNFYYILLAGVWNCITLEKGQAVS